MCHTLLANILFWLFLAQCQIFWICNGIFYFLSLYLVLFSCSHYTITQHEGYQVCNTNFCTHLASQFDKWLHTQKYLKSKKFYCLISLFVSTHWMGNIFCNYFLLSWDQYYKLIEQNMWLKINTLLHWYFALWPIT